MLSPYCGWDYVLSHDVRPNSSIGAVVTPGNNTYGSYATVLGTPLANDALGIEITIIGATSSAAVTDSLTTIGIDLAGGTSYADFIQHLFSGGSGLPGGSNTGAVKYFFPVRIPAGATIGAKATINNATVGTQQVYVKLWTKPSNRNAMPRIGSYVTTFGADTANSAGTSVTAGTASNGSYTQLGSAISGRELWYWVMALHNKNDSTLNAAFNRGDLAVGNATNKKIILLAQEQYSNATESQGVCNRGEYGLGPVGANVYARIWSGTGDTTFGALAYGVGG